MAGCQIAQSQVISHQCACHPLKKVAGDRQGPKNFTGPTFRWRVHQSRFHQARFSRSNLRGRAQSGGSKPRASESLSGPNQSKSLPGHPHRAAHKPNPLDPPPERGTAHISRRNTSRWRSFLLEFIVGCIVATVLPATAFWFFFWGQRVRSQQRPCTTIISSIQSPAPSSRSDRHSVEKQIYQPRAAEYTQKAGALSAGLAANSCIENVRSPKALPNFEPSDSARWESNPALLFAEQDSFLSSRVHSGSQAGPSGREGSPNGGPSPSPAQPSFVARVSQPHHPALSEPPLVFSPNPRETASQNFPASATGLSLVSSQSPLVQNGGASRARLVWDSGIDPAATTPLSTSHALPFLTPPPTADPFSCHAVWDSGSEPARATSATTPERPPVASSLWGSAVKLCSHKRLRSGSGLKLTYSFGWRAKGNSFVRAAAERVGPAVVRLNTERNHPNETGAKDLFSKFFGGEELALEDRGKDLEQGQGSGFVIDGQKGIIMTNAHVINRADTVLVTFTDGRTYRGAVVGTDELTDLAVVKVDLPLWESVPKAPLGDSNTLEVGDWVIAVGNPFGLDNTVTLGIVSSLHRQAAEIGIPEKRVDFLQTDCAINPGNSGGPLINEFGEVVGINTAIRADAEGISFAIPINYARKIVDVLSQGRPVRHAYIGVKVVTITPELARQHNSEPRVRAALPEVRGVLVANVADGSPAEAAGLRAGDVILEMDGRPLRSTGELQSVIAYSDVGQVIRVKIRRETEIVFRRIVAGDLTPLLPAPNAGPLRT